MSSSLFCSAHFYDLILKSFALKIRLLILVAREGFLKDKFGPRAKKFEHHLAKAARQEVVVKHNTDMR